MNPKIYYPLGEPPRSAEPKEACPTLPQAMSRLAEMCKWNDPELYSTLLNIQPHIRKHGLSLQAVLTSTDYTGEPLIIPLITNGRADVLSLLHSQLQTGWILYNSVQRTNEKLLLHSTEDKTRSFGFEKFGKGCTYIGDFENGIRQGKGKLQYSDDWYYEGDFFENKKHGLGADVLEGAFGHRWEGIFTFDEFRGNPHQIDRPESVWRTVLGLGHEKEKTQSNAGPKKERK